METDVFSSHANCSGRSLAILYPLQSRSYHHHLISANRDTALGTERKMASDILCTSITISHFLFHWAYGTNIKP